ncbi:MAG: DNA-3-methyladenine glycosylase 2 family protein [Proteobacteria bacterium]|nr:DNA-3-methyladenine glycosylase 2 family protein [Pseudomonadota bacterium]
MIAPPAELNRMRRHLRAADPVLAQLLRAAGRFTLEPRLAHTPFWSLARAIANQQLNGTAAATILARFVALYPGHEFPAPRQVLATDDLTLRGVGFSFAKVAALKDLAEKTETGVVPSTRSLVAMADSEIIERLTQVRGVGRWTVEMLLMFQLGRPDVFPADDFGIQNGFRLAYGIRAMPTPRALADYALRWAPYRTMAAWYLWRAVDLDKLGKLPTPPLRTRIKTVKPKPRLKRRGAICITVPP